MDEIHIAPYDPAWPAAFKAERALILERLPRPPLAIEHMGSTAVPGLSAKPVIDIIVLVESLEDARPAIPALEAMGYSFWAANPDRSRLFLVKGLPPAPRRTHHLHIHDHPDEFARHIAFRDSLRADAELRARYAALKAGLAERHRQDREAYTAAKTDFIAAALARQSGSGWMP